MSFNGISGLQDHIFVLTFWCIFGFIIRIFSSKNMS